LPRLRTTEVRWEGPQTLLGGQSLHAKLAEGDDLRRIFVKYLGNNAE
jgi:hypothetical protein